MTQTGHAVIAEGQTFTVAEYPVPDPAPGTVLLRQELAGICGTDLHWWQQGIEPAMLLGHENVGIIAALGKGVTTDDLGTPVKEGDRVVFHPRNSGISNGMRGPDEPFSGGFADYIYLTDPMRCMIKSEKPPQVGVLAEPFTIGVHAALRANIKIGDTVIIQGSGPIGIMCMIAARISGAGKLDRHRRARGRLELARKLGAHETVDIGAVPDAGERKEIVLGLTPAAPAATWSSRPPASCPPSPKGSSWSNRTASSSRPATSSTSVRSRSTRTAIFCAPTCAWKACGAAATNTSSAPCRSWRAATSTSPP